MKATLCLILTLLLCITYGTVIAAPPDKGPSQTPFYGYYYVKTSYCEQFVTPKNSILIIESISCHGVTHVYQRITCDVVVIKDPLDPADEVQQAKHHMMPIMDEGGLGYFSWVQPLKLYAPPESLVRVCARNAGEYPYSEQINFSLAGHYEPY